jgi:small-conductance mechanosensitive channel
MCKRFLISGVLLLAIVSLSAACSTAPPTNVPNATATSALPGIPLTPEPDEPIENDLIGQLIITPTPEPTATPSPLEEAVSEVAITTGLNQILLLGLTGEDWVNLGISLLITLVGIFIIARVIYFILRKIAEATQNQYDDQILDAVGAQIRWLIVIWIINFATRRLPFLDPEWKQWLESIYFTLIVVLITWILWKLIDLGFEWYRERQAAQEGDRSNVLPSFLRRTFHLILVIVSLAIISNEFGVNLTVLLILLGIGGLAVSLAAQDTISDVINGVIILLDQPFRVKDRIGIHDLDTWGDVVDIGARTTRIRTRDNRLVIVPNATIGRSQVVNYSFPDPRYRVQTEIGIAYGSDLERSRTIVLETVRNVEGVLPGRPVEALFIEFGDSAIKILVRWWIHSFTDTRTMFDRVHSALYKALMQAGVEMPFTTFDLNLQMRSKKTASQTNEVDSDQREISS